MPWLGLLTLLTLLVAACGSDEGVEAYFEAVAEVDATVEARGDIIVEPSPDDPATIPAFFEHFLLQHGLSASTMTTRPERVARIVVQQAGAGGDISKAYAALCVLFDQYPWPCFHPP